MSPDSPLLSSCNLLAISCEFAVSRVSAVYVALPIRRLCAGARLRASKVCGAYSRGQPPATRPAAYSWPHNDLVRNVALGLAILVVLASGAALFLYQPVARGHVGGRDAAGLIDPELTTLPGSIVYTYRYAPGADYYTATTIRNDGPLPITINGPDPVLLRDCRANHCVGPWPDAMLIGQDDPHVFFNEPRTAPSAGGSTIDPGEELAVWVHWRMGSYCPPGEPVGLGPGGSESTDFVAVSWSVLGLPRTSYVPLGYGFVVTNPENDPLITCPAVA